MNVYSSGVNCGSLWVTFGSLLAYENDFGFTLGSLLACVGDFGVTLESFFAYDDDFVATLGSLLAFRAALGPIWH